MAVFIKPRRRTFNNANFLELKAGQRVPDTDVHSLSRRNDRKSSPRCCKELFQRFAVAPSLEVRYMFYCAAKKELKILTKTKGHDTLSFHSCCSFWRKKLCFHWSLLVKNVKFAGCRLAQLVEQTSNVQRLCPRCSGPRFDSWPGSLCCVSPPSPQPVSCPNLQLFHQ